MSTTPPGPPKASSGAVSPKNLIPDAVAVGGKSGTVDGCQRIVVYGTGGIGKTTLAAYLPSPLFLDVEGGTYRMDVLREEPEDFMALRGMIVSMIQNGPPKGVQSIVIDTITQVEEMVCDYVVEHRRTEKGQQVHSVEAFGWGKGWQFVSDEMNALLRDLGRLSVKHKLAVCLIAHDVPAEVPNPAGENFIRWAPKLYAGDKKGRGSIQDRVKNWCDHMLFISYDIVVEDGRASGSGTRTVYTTELPTHLAKSRTFQGVTPFSPEKPDEVWHALGIIKKSTAKAAAPSGPPIA